MILGKQEVELRTPPSKGPSSRLRVIQDQFEGCDFKNHNDARSTLNPRLARLLRHGEDMSIR
jgi:hypothetical protein